MCFDANPNLPNLFVRDNEYDLGNEPSNAEYGFKRSPDIQPTYLHKTFESSGYDLLMFSNAEHTQDFDIVIRNKGNLDYSQSNMYAHLFWVNDSAKMTTADWLLNVNNSSNKDLWCGVIGSKKIDTVMPVNSSAVLRFLWTPGDTFLTKLNDDLNEINEPHYLPFNLFLLIDNKSNHVDDVIQQVVKCKQNVLISNKIAQYDLFITYDVVTHMILRSLSNNGSNSLIGIDFSNETTNNMSMSFTCVGESTRYYNYIVPSGIVSSNYTIPSKKGDTIIITLRRGNQILDQKTIIN